MAKGDGYLLVGTRNSQSAVTIIAASGTEMLITDIGDSSTNYSGIFMFDTTQTNYRIPLMSTSRYGGSYGYIFGWSSHGRGKDKSLIITDDTSLQFYDAEGSGTIYYWVTGIYTN